MKSSGVHGPLILPLVLVLLATLPVPSVPSGAPWGVHMVNKLKGPPNLLVQCKSKDDELGYHYLPVGQEFFWQFSSNIWGSTLYWCYLAPNSSYGLTFNAYDDNDSFYGKRCQKGERKQCFWVAKDDGIYFTDFRQNPPLDEFKYNWQKGAFAGAVDNN